MIEAYDKLMAFCLKHMDNRFVLEHDISIDARELIAREVIGNILIHRDYSNAFPAKLIIEKNTLKTENWSKSRFNGKLELETFSPYPKNPLLASFFVNIGRADKLGSGMRNLYKYTKLYSHATPTLSEGDIFKIQIPLLKSDFAPEKSDFAPEKSDFAPEKSDFASEKSDFGYEKISLDILMQKCNEQSYNVTVIDNMKTIYEKINDGQVFGTSDIAEILDCAKSTASGIMKRLRNMDVLISIKGKGKGKYRFKYMSEYE